MTATAEKIYDPTGIDWSVLKKNLGNRTWRLNNLYRCRDDKGQIVRFQMKPEQRKYYEGMHWKNNILKARQIGFTTNECILQLDASMFEGASCAMIADRLPTAYRLFREKTQFAYDGLPQVLKEVNPPIKNAAGDIVFTNGGSLYVDVSFRGGTAQRLHVSEFGKICARYPEKAREIVTGAFPAVTNGVITIESTAEGQEGFFYDITMESMQADLSGRGLTPLDFKFFFFPWWVDPRYSLAYAEKGYQIPHRLFEYFDELEHKHKIKLTPQQKLWYAKVEATLGFDMFREYPSTPQEAFRATIEGAYYADQFRDLWRAKQIRHVPHDAAACVHTIWDIGHNDSTAIWFVQRIGTEWHIIDYYENSGHGMQFYFDILDKRRLTKKYRYGTHVGPHDIEVHEFGNEGKTRRATAKALGFHFEVAPSLSIEDGRSAVRNILPLCWFDESHCEDGLAALQGYRREWDAKHGTWKPSHLKNWATHGADSFRYFAISLNLLIEGYTSAPVAQQQQPARRIV